MESIMIREESCDKLNKPGPVHPSGGERPMNGAPAKVSAEQVNFYYGKAQALYGISLEIPEKKITALIGPSGCGSPPSCAP